MKYRDSIVAILLFLIILTHTKASPTPDYNTIALKKINAVFTNLCATNKFVGTALIAINGKIRFEGACGLANRDFLIPNTIETTFNLGSVGKIFTSVSIAQLVEDKKLSLDTHAIQLVPSWLNMPNGREITIRQLLIHASGLGNFMDDNRWKLGADSGLYLKTDDYRPLITSKNLRFKPGTNQAYSNSGYLLLGKIIEKLSHQPYSQYIQHHILDVANMTNTGLYPLDTIVQNKAVGYYYACKETPCQWKNNYFEAPFSGNAAGGIYSTIHDLFKFSQALYHNNLLDSNFTKQLLSEVLNQPTKNLSIKYYKIGNQRIPENISPYGFAGAWNTFGLAVWPHPNLIGHTGGTTGAAALFIMSPDNHYTIIILSNISAGTTLLYQQIRNALGFKSPIENF